MPQDLQTCVVKILKQDGTIAGTGFVVAQRLAVTCAHVVELADGEPGEAVEVEFYHGGKRQNAQILVEGWSHPQVEDVAFLQ